MNTITLFNYPIQTAEENSYTREEHWNLAFARRTLVWGHYSSSSASSSHFTNGSSPFTNVCLQIVTKAQNFTAIISGRHHTQEQQQNKTGGTSNINIFQVLMVVSWSSPE
jgi:hypothetical protein